MAFDRILTRKLVLNCPTFEHFLGGLFTWSCLMGANISHTFLMLVVTIDVPTWQNVVPISVRIKEVRWVATNAEEVVQFLLQTQTEERASFQTIGVQLLVLGLEPVVIAVVVGVEGLLEGVRLGLFASLGVDPPEVLVWLVDAIDAVGEGVLSLVRVHRRATLVIDGHTQLMANFSTVNKTSTLTCLPTLQMVVKLKYYWYSE